MPEVLSKSAAAMELALIASEKTKVKLTVEELVFSEVDVARAKETMVGDIVSVA